MRYRYFKYDDTELYPRPVGVTLGCGCCAKDIVLTKELVDMHIRSLQDDIKEARKVRKIVAKLDRAKGAK